ncbi:MAG: biotin synthase BioB [Candidatus Hydrogenedentota bacterium]|nr:MAG: biotin synthase BioB [Candidatus Hydrogenedentota bacterium]
MQLEEAIRLYNKPLLDLVYFAAKVHRKYHNPNEIQVCTLLSLKTGGCSEDCAYCAQSARYQTPVINEQFLDPDTVYAKAEEAKQNGSSRFCMGVAWREVPSRGKTAQKRLNQLIQAIEAAASTGLEVCLTAGMLNEQVAKKLKAAGLHVYNHNLDTSPEYYPRIITTRTYKDRLQTLEAVAKAGISICSGGIIGMGESPEDRVKMLWILSNLKVPPESVPINNLVPIPGTPLEKQKPAESFDMVRTIAVARILMPKAKIRLAAGREALSEETQALCFLAGANSIFSGKKLLTTPNAGIHRDKLLFEKLGLK